MRSGNPPKCRHMTDSCQVTWCALRRRRLLLSSDSAVTTKDESALCFGRFGADCLRPSGRPGDEVIKASRAPMRSSAMERLRKPKGALFLLCFIFRHNAKKHLGSERELFGSLLPRTSQARCAQVRTRYVCSLPLVCGEEKKKMRGGKEFYFRGRM